MIKVNKFVSITASLLLALSSSCAITGTQTIPNTNLVQMLQGKKEPYYGDISLKLDTGLIEKAGGKLTFGRFQKELFSNNSFSVKSSKDDEDKKVEKLDRYDFSKHKNNEEHVKNKDKILFNPNLPNLGLDGLTPYDGQIKSGLTSIAMCEVNGVEEKILTGKLIVEFDGDYNTKLQQFLDRYGAIELNSFVTPDNTLMVLIAIADTSKQVANLANNIKQTNAIAYPATQSITFSSVDALKTVAMFYDIYVNSSDLVSGLAFNHPAEETEKINNTTDNNSFSTQAIDLSNPMTRSGSPSNTGNIVTDEESSLGLKSTSLDWLENETSFSPNITKAWQYSQGEDTVVAVIDSGFGLLDKYKDTFGNRVIYKPELLVNDYNEWKPYCNEARKQEFPSADYVKVKTKGGNEAFSEPINVRDTPSFVCYPTYRDNNLNKSKYCKSSLLTYKSACYNDSQIESKKLVKIPSHGFSVSSIISSETDNFKHIAGVAPKSKILPIAYNADSYLDDYTFILSFSKLNNYINSGGKVDVLSISTSLEMIPTLGQDRRTWDHLTMFSCPISKNCINSKSFTLKKISKTFNNPVMYWLNNYISYLSEDLKIPVVVAAGNDNVNTGNYLPAMCDKSITVGAYENLGNSIRRSNLPTLGDDKKSNFGKGIDIWANGNSTYTFIPNASIENFAYSKVSIQGTSFATPIVSGTVALMKSWNKSLKGSEIRNILKSTGYILPSNGDFKNEGEDQKSLNSLKALENVQITSSKYTSISGLYNSNNTIKSNNIIYYPTIDYTNNTYSDLVGKSVTVTGWVNNNTKSIKVLQIREGSIPQNNEKWYIRIFNVDDSGYSAIKINNCTVSSTNNCFSTLLTAGYGQDTGYYDITNFISSGENTLKFQMYNYGGGYTWGFHIKRGDSIVFNQSSGTSGVSGANNNDQNSTYRYVYDKEITFSTNDRNLVEKNNLTGQVINRTY